MKKILTILALFAMTATVTFAQTNQAETPTEAKEQTDGPVMEFEKTTVDYGTIEQGSDPFRVFTFTNVGNEPLIISNAKGSCGCTVPTYPKEPIMPGDKAEIKVRYDTNRVGPFTKTVTLTTNEATPSKRLIIKGKVEKKKEEESVPASTPSIFNSGSGN